MNPVRPGEAAVGRAADEQRDRERRGHAEGLACEVRRPVGPERHRGVSSDLVAAGARDRRIVREPREAGDEAVRQGGRPRAPTIEAHVVGAAVVQVEVVRAGAHRMTPWREVVCEYARGTAHARAASTRDSFLTASPTRFLGSSSRPPGAVVRRSFVVLSVVGLSGVAGARGLAGQQPVTRAQAVAAALERGARVALGRADTAAARGFVRAARAFPNPSFSATYTKAVPQYHAIVDLPLDVPWLRAPRIGAAEFARAAARSGFAFERAAIRFDVDTTYTRALAAAAHARLSRHTARDADSLLTMARLRREVGDASELDVRLAAVNAGQLENVASDDSLTSVAALLSVQLAMGLPGEESSITLADSLGPPPADSAVSGTAEPLPVAAAAASLRSAERALTLAHRSVFGAPSLQLGVEHGDPTGSEPGVLPTVGLSLPLPLFHWNGGARAGAPGAGGRGGAAGRSG